MLCNFRYIPPSPSCLIQDITEIMHNEQTQENSSIEENDNPDPDRKIKVEEFDCKENYPDQNDVSKFINSAWDSSEVSYLAETPVCIIILIMFNQFYNKGN